MSKDDRREIQRWGISAAVVLAVHLGSVALALNYKPAASLSEAPSAIVVELSPVAMSPTVQETDLAPGPEQQQSVAQKPATEKKQQKKEEETADTPPVEKAEVPLPPPAEKKPDAVAEPEPHRTEPEKRQASTQSVASAPTPMPRQGERSAAPLNSASQQRSSSIPNWRSLLAAILERNKRYPPEAQSRGDRGVATVSFVINRSGGLVSAALVSSSGSTALDREAVALIHRSQPFPAPPAELPGSAVSIVVPVRFNVR